MDGDREVVYDIRYVETGEHAQSFGYDKDIPAGFYVLVDADGVLVADAPSLVEAVLWAVEEHGSHLDLEGGDNIDQWLLVEPDEGDD